MRTRTIVGIGFLILLVIVSFIYLKPNKTKDSLAYKEEQYNIYCGSCHLVPDPKNIPKYIWKNKVLPEMAAKMGYVYNNNVPSQSSMEERYYVKKSNAYPNTPMIDSVKWNLIQDYILNLAPDTVYNLPNKKVRNSKLSQFSVLFDSVNNNMLKQSLVHINYHSLTNQLLISDIYGNLFDVKNGKGIGEKFNSPIISSVIKDSSLYLTEIGILNPSEIPRGAIYKKNKDSLSLLYKDLHRPVYSVVADINSDTVEEIIICEFGYHAGELSMLVQKDSILEKKTLATLPGSIKVEIKDMNGDGKKDIIALFSQAKEGVYILYQKNDLEFDIQQVIQMGPEFGVSWFELVDYNKDGYLDIILVNGDNADYSIFPKPYHGLRLYLNNGNNDFEEKWFYPINGATRLLIEDFDLDGDLDFAVLSFFPDMINCPEEGFVYLENKDSPNYIFESYITPESKNGRWLVMDKGDFDNDGDIDIMLGGFHILPKKGSNTTRGYNHLFLYNNELN